MLHWKLEAIRHPKPLPYNAEHHWVVNVWSGNKLLASCWWALVCQRLGKQLHADGSLLSLESDIFLGWRQYSPSRCEISCATICPWTACSMNFHMCNTGVLSPSFWENSLHDFTLELTVWLKILEGVNRTRCQWNCQPWEHLQPKQVATLFQANCVLVGEFHLMTYMSNHQLNRTW